MLCAEEKREYSQTQEKVTTNCYVFFNQLKCSCLRHTIENDFCDQKAFHIFNLSAARWLSTVGW